MISSLISIIRKDFRLLFRSKSSTLAVLLGPLLIILLVGLVFTNAGEPEIVIGVVSEDFETSDLYLDTLDRAFIVVDFDEVSRCSDAVISGRVVSCVSLEDADPPRARIFVDTSDVNVVYAVLDRITGQIENQSSVLRSGFADELIDTLGKTGLKLKADEEQLKESQLIVNDQIDKLEDLTSGLKDISIEVSFLSRSEVSEAIDVALTARDDYRFLLENVILDYRQYVQTANLADENTTINEIDDYEDELDIIIDDSEGKSDKVFSELLSSIDDISDEVERSEEAAQAHVSQARQIKNSIARADANLKQVVASVTKTGESIGELDISKSDVANPIQPVIETLVAEDDSFGFIFPFFIMLIIMFTSVLLASNIIVKERSSFAYFRNFTTPTPQWLFVIAVYITTTIVLALQIIIIYIAATFLISFPITGNIGTALLVLWAGVTFFTLLGMLLGYILRSHEGVMLASITVASILLFVSSLVLPVETIPAALQAIVKLNPFVMLSDMFKANIVFGFGFMDIIKPFIAILLYSVMLFAAIMIVQRVARIRYFEVTGSAEKISEFLGEEDIPEGKELTLGKYVVGTKPELVAALKKMSDDEYEKFCTHRHNKIADWIRDVYKDDRLANLLKNKSRKGAVAVLEKES